MLAAIILTASCTSTYAQWECPGQLGAYLKPVGKSPLLWGIELTAGAGTLDKNRIFNSMGLIGVDYSFGKNSFYAEGGFKYWNRQDDQLNVNFDQKHLGLRELFYQTKSDNSRFTLGIHSSKMEDGYLLNERIIGMSYKQFFGKFSLGVTAGSVTKDFARNGTFCNVSYLYDIIPLRDRSLIGNSPGQTNLAGVTLSFLPSRVSTTSSDIGPGTLTSGEFSDGLEAEPVSKAIKLESVGMVIYNEFGKWISSPVLMGGFYANMDLFNGLNVKPELLYQAANLNNALIYSLILEKSFGPGHSRTSLNARYIGLSAIDSNAKPLNSFSNIFSGDVLRLDTPDLPVYQFGIKQTFSKYKFHLKFQATGQAKSDPMHEYDLEAGKKFFNRLQINGTAGMVITPSLNDKIYLARIELRYYF
jgi:hypothetical protein